MTGLDLQKNTSQAVLGTLAYHPAKLHQVQCHTKCNAPPKAMLYQVQCHIKCNGPPSATAYQVLRRIECIGAPSATQNRMQRHTKYNATEPTLDPQIQKLEVTSL